MTDAGTDDVLEIVRDQYEDFPYPPRDPEEEKQRLLMPFGGASLEEINHYCFGGHKDWTTIRILVAGGGTGDAVIHLAEQLKEQPNASLVYLDMSQASMDIAKARAEIRGLTNIEWHLDSLLNLPVMGLEPFDFINCTGVLHHLPDPEAGLKALADCLTPEGSLFLMLYGRYGRHAVYHTQELFRSLIPRELPQAEKIAQARHWLKAFPKSNFFIDGLPRFEHECDSDIGLLDLLLHNQDRAYTVDEIYQFLSSCQLNLVDFTGMFATGYKLQHIVADMALLQTLGARSIQEQQSLAERIGSTLHIHNFYASKSDHAQASIANEDNIIITANAMRGRAAQLAQAIVPGQPVNVNFPGQAPFSMGTSEATRAIFTQLEQGFSVGEIISRASAMVPAATEADIRGDLAGIFDFFRMQGLMYLKGPTVANYPLLDYGSS